jgi:ATP-dependent exoDNAse (exonuclease V) beta subunit
VALPVPEPYGHRFIAAREIERSLPDAVGAYVEWLVRDSGWTVTERRAPEERVPIEARHICILFRRFVSYGEDITRKYVEALEARGIRHLLVGGRAYHNREEIETLRAALMAIEWPDDQLSVFATLRGALFAIGDEELLEYFRLAGKFHPFRIPEHLPLHLQPVGEGLSQLAALHRQRNRVTVADTIAALLTRTRAHVGFVLRPDGEQALANVLHVAELARQYELEGGMSFRGFVETLHAEAAAATAAEAPILEEGSDGVRLMTVHKAKGLEFPVVILADITARLAPFEASRYLDAGHRLCALRIGGWSPIDLIEHRDDEVERERAEGERVAYVAATRARDLLVVPAVGDEPYAEGWVSPLNAAIYPADDARRVQAPAPGCPVFASKDTVRNRPDSDPATRLTVCPGEHRVGPDGSVSVVWWAPDALRLDAEALFGFRRDDLIVKDVPASVMRKYLDTYSAWRAERDAAIARAARRSIDVMTATEWAKGDSLLKAEASTPRGEDIDVAIESIVLDERRPGGRRFGTLVHALLGDVPIGGSDSKTVSRLAEAYGRILGAEAAEVAAAGETVKRVLAHPALEAAARAAQKGFCYREMPVTWRLDTGAIVEGVVDLAYVDGEQLVVIEFKTDRELDGAIDRYRRQLQLYAAAIGGATGRPARAILMRV